MREIRGHCTFFLAFHYLSLRFFFCSFLSQNDFGSHVFQQLLLPFFPFLCISVETLKKHQCAPARRTINITTYAY